LRIPAFNVLNLRVLLDELADLGSNEEVHDVLKGFLQIEGTAVLSEFFLYLNEAPHKSIHSEPAL
jgi:hypothetical protein